MLLIILLRVNSPAPPEGSVVAQTLIDQRYRDLDFAVSTRRVSSQLSWIVSQTAFYVSTKRGRIAVLARRCKMPFGVVNADNGSV
jgi:hypothetical protein